MKTNEITILNNAMVYSKDYQSSRESSILIIDGVIRGIGDSGMYDSLISSDTKIINCNGNLVLPGFIDSHLHIPGSILYDKYGINLITQSTIEDYLNLCKSYSKNLSDDIRTIRGFGWKEAIVYNNSKYREKEVLRNKLDQIFPDIPVVIYSADFHSCWCNTQTLNLCGINKETPNPLGGIIEKDEFRELSGILKETAVELLKPYDSVLGFSTNEMRASILEYQDVLHAYGITSVQTMMFIGGNYSKEWNILKDIEKDGLLKININGTIPVRPEDNPETIINTFNNMQKYNSKRIQIKTAKLYIDGVLDNMTALLEEPYENTTFTGIPFWDNKKLKKMCLALHNSDIQMHAHAIGDRAVHDIVSSYLYSINNSPASRKSNHVVTHVQLCKEEDIELMAKYGIVANIQPFWIPISMEYYRLDKRMIGERAERQYKVGSFIEAGVILTSSSDNPVTVDFSPVLGIACGVNRMGQYSDEKIHNESERVDVSTMIDSYTRNGAIQLMRDDQIGSIAVGMDADLVVLSENILNMKTDDIFKSQAIITLSKGEVVFNRNSISKKY